MLSEPWRAVLLGTAELRCGDNVVARFRDRTIMALLAALMLQPEMRAPRDYLIEQLWPDEDPADTRNRLRVLLHRLRAIVEPLGVQAGTVLIAHRHDIGLNREAFSCDALDFVRACNTAKAIQEPAERVAYTERAAQLYTGELLPGVYHQWVLDERERLAGLHFDMLRRLTQDSMACGDPERGVTYAKQAAVCEPLDEEAQFDLIRLLGTVGRTSEALRSYDHFRTVLHSELGAVPSAPTQNLVSLLGQRRGGGAQIYGPPKTGSRRTSVLPHKRHALTPDPATRPLSGHQLPVRLTRFFGRDEEISTICALLSPETQSRLVTLLGPAGVGKTRLALESARSLQRQYPGRVFFVPLTEITDVANIPTAILHALQLTPVAGDDAMVQAAAYLAQAPALIVLDNMEQLLPQATGLLAQLAGEVAPLRCLVTSRRSIGVEGEWVYPIAPLALPGHEESDERLAGYPAVALFVDRARAARVDFAVTKQNAAAIIGLCRRLEGIPLALELAAARSRVLTVGEMLEQIGTGIDWLVDPRRGREARHRSLREAIEWSYPFIGPRTAQIFQCLSAFAGGFTCEAAAAVCDLPHESLDEAAAMLESLCSDSLIVGREDAAGRTRFDMLESLRTFGMEKLACSGRERAVRKRHLRWFTEYAETPKREDAASLRAYADEDSNFRAALEFGLRPEADAEERELAARLASILPDHFVARGNLAEGRAVLKRVIALNLEAALTGAVRLGAARLAIRQGDYSDAVALTEAGLADTRIALDFTMQAAYLMTMGVVEFHKGDYGAAGQHLNLALVKLGRAPETNLAAECLLNLGLVHWYQAEHNEARNYFERAKRIYSDQGSQRGVAECLLKLGNVYRDQGDAVTGEAMLNQALDVFQALDHRQHVANALHDLGIVAEYCGEYALAESRFTRALAAFGEVGSRVGCASCLHNLAALAVGFGRWEDGQKLVVEAMEIYQRTGERREYAASLLTLSGAYEVAGRIEDATLAAAQAVEIDSSIGSPIGLIVSLNRLGRMYVFAGRMQEATGVLLNALARALTVQSRPATVLALYSFVYLFHKHGNYLQAARTAAAAAESLRTAGARHMPFESNRLKALLEDLRIALGDAEFATAWTAGQRLPLADLQLEITEELDLSAIFAPS